MTGMFEEGCSGKRWQGKVLRGALNGENFCRGVGVWGPFLHGTWKGLEFWLATVIACRGLGRGYRREGGIPLKGCWQGRPLQKSMPINFLRAVYLGSNPAVRSFSRYVTDIGGR